MAEYYFENFRFLTSFSGLNFPATASEYAAMIEPELGVVPTVDVGDMVEMPLYKNGVQVFGAFSETEIDNPTRLGDITISGSAVQRYEGKRADGTPIPEAVWVALLRLQGDSNSLYNAGVQLIGYNQNTGATAFFEAGNFENGAEDYISEWIMADASGNFSGLMPNTSNPADFNLAYITPPGDQCIACHQADPFITDPWINGAKILGTNETVVPHLAKDVPYYVIGGDNWDMRTIRIEGNQCLSCHRVGLNTLQLFETNGYDTNARMPPNNPGSMSDDYVELMNAWLNGVENTPNAEWVIPAVGALGPDQVVGDDYPYKACFNHPSCNE